MDLPRMKHKTRLGLGTGTRRTRTAGSRGHSGRGLGGAAGALDRATQQMTEVTQDRVAYWHPQRGIGRVVGIDDLDNKIDCALRND